MGPSRTSPNQQTSLQKCNQIRSVRRACLVVPSDPPGKRLGTSGRLADFFGIVLEKGNTMTNAGTPVLTIAIISSQHLVRAGLQQLIETQATVPMVVHPHHGRIHDLLRTGIRPDLFILDLETDCEALSTIKQIREAAQTSKIVLLCGIEDQDR